MEQVEQIEMNLYKIAETLCKNNLKVYFMELLSEEFKANILQQIENKMSIVIIICDSIYSK